jgi:ubiquinone/menaquinone biosynthesis C-methylase UbiE
MPHSETFKIKDASSYDDVSAQFDVFSRTLTLPFAERMIRLAGVRPTDLILDIGTGTGIVAFNAARSVPQGKVTGIDLSEGMLATAREKAQQASPRSSVEFLRMDAERLEFKDGTFDVVLSLFAVLHFPNPSAALSEMFRVLRPGGRLVFAVGGGPALFSTATVVEGIRRVRQLFLQQTGRLLVAPAFLDSLVEKYLPEPVHTETSALAQAGLHRASDVLTLVREAKFTNVLTGWHGHRAVLKTVDEFWRIQSTFSSLARKRLAAAPADKLRALKDEFFTVCNQVQARGGNLEYPMGAFFVKAEKPRA